MRVPKAVQLPSGSYRCQVTVDGKRISVTSPDPLDAIAKAIALRDGKKRTPGAMTLGRCIDEFISLREPVLSPSTVKAYRSYRKYRFQAHMDTKLSALDHRTLQRMVSEEAKTVSPKTLKNAWALVGASLKEYGVDTSGIVLPAVPVAERPWLTAEEVLVFCDKVRGEPCEIPALLALCSLRRSEIAALTWDDIDLKNNIINVRKSLVEGEDGFVLKKTNKTKGSTRKVPIIIPQLRDALAAVPEKKGRIITKHPNVIYQQVNRVCEKAGLPRCGIHGLRHSFASLCHFLSIPPLECSRIAGWEDLRTMYKIYTHISDRQMNDATEKLTSFFK